MKIPVRYPDGINRGGLLKMDCINPRMRKWDGPPHAEYREMMLDYSEDRSGPWFLLWLSHFPQTTGSKECDDLYDHASHALGLKAPEARRWFERHGMEVPSDLLDNQENVAPVDNLVVPLTDTQQEVWDLLEAKHLSAKEIAATVYGTGLADGAVRRIIDRIRKTGRRIENRRGRGYYRPDVTEVD